MGYKNGKGMKWLMVTEIEHVYLEHMAGESTQGIKSLIYFYYYKNGIEDTLCHWIIWIFFKVFPQSFEKDWIWFRVSMILASQNWNVLFFDLELGSNNINLIWPYMYTRVESVKFLSTFFILVIIITDVENVSLHQL